MILARALHSHSYPPPYSPETNKYRGSRYQNPKHPPEWLAVGKAANPPIWPARSQNGYFDQLIARYFMESPCADSFGRDRDQAGMWAIICESCGGRGRVRGSRPWPRCPTRLTMIGLVRQLRDWPRCGPFGITLCADGGSGGDCVRLVLATFSGLFIFDACRFG